MPIAALWLLASLDAGLLAVFIAFKSWIGSVLAAAALAFALSSIHDHKMMGVRL